jgi:hypothetical protein
MGVVNLWSSVGSAGTVNPPDIGKVLLVGSIAQLGGGRGGVVTGPREVAAVVSAGVAAGPETQAVIRYAVTAVNVASDSISNVALEIVCRRGSGQITARLVQVSFVSINDPVPSVIEQTVVEVKAPTLEPNLFSLQVGNGSGLDFEANAYYVEVVLTAAANVVTQVPPAIATIQLVTDEESAVGGGGGSVGGGGGGEGGHHRPQ